MFMCDVFDGTTGTMNAAGAFRNGHITVTCNSTTRCHVLLVVPASWGWLVSAKCLVGPALSHAVVSNFELKI